MPLTVKQPTIIGLEAFIKPESKSAFVEWQGKFNAALAAFPGFISLEFSAPLSDKKGWLIVQRFANEEALTSWRESNEYHKLLAELKKLLNQDGLKESLTDASNQFGNVTEVFVTEVNPARAKDYNVWLAKIHEVEAKFPGFRGTYVQSPNEGKGSHWITLLQFDSLANLEGWLESDERKELLQESSSMISSLETHRVISPYAGWFGSIEKGGDVPSPWKQAMLILLVLFPIVMIELKYLSPLTASLDVSLATFIGNAISVSLITFPMIPMAIWCLSWWLQSHSPRITILGTIMVSFLYLIEIALFWKFLY